MGYSLERGDMEDRELLLGKLTTTWSLGRKLRNKTSGERTLSDRTPEFMMSDYLYLSM